MTYADFIDLTAKKKIQILMDIKKVLFQWFISFF